MMPLPYLRKQLRSSYVRCVRLGCLVKRNSDALPLLESLNESQESIEELEILHLESPRVMLVEVVSLFYRLKPTTSTSTTPQSSPPSTSQLIYLRRAVAAKALSPVSRVQHIDYNQFCCFHVREDKQGF